MTDLDTPILEESVRDCLAHLYDYTFLQEHPLVRLLVPHGQGTTSRVQIFQNLVLSAIERLKPSDPANPQAKNSRFYSILSLRYQRQQQVQLVLKQLNLGERQFYRDHAKAVQALTHVLEEQVKEDPTIPANSLSIHAELERAHRQSTPALITSEIFLRKTLIAVKGLLERRQSEVDIQTADTILPGSIDQTLLRQVIIWIISQLLTQTPPGTRFVISFKVKHDTAQVIFARRSEDPLVEGADHLFAERQQTLETLLNALGASLYEVNADEHHADVVLELPFQQHSVLIIDDNPDAVALIRHFLSGQPYQILTAYDGAQAITLARETQPILIMLDVLLPNQDGWEILQHLKNHPATIHIPVVICSVLDAADLAILLGADGFLLKPPQEADFLDMLQRCVTNH